MKLKLFSVICILLLLFTASVFSATTGKITGVITDADNQQPLIGVSVAIQGTSMGAITDVDGRYIILNVPVGTYTVKFSAIGYQAVEITQIDVHADLATFQNRSLSSTVTDIDKTISVVADNPMIIKDKTTTINIVKAEEILALPTRGFEQIIGLQNSVVRMNSNADIAQRGGAAQKADGPSINIRGGRPSEVAYYIDGISQQDPLTGLSTANLSNNAIAEVSIQSGAFSAEYGNVMSGIVNVVTKSGGENYEGTVEVVTDNFASGAKKVYDHNYYTADVSGPLPGLENGYFYVSGGRTYLQDRTPSPITEEIFGKFGVPNENGNVLPNNALSRWQYQGKLTYDFSPNIKFTLNGNGSVDNWQSYRHNYNNPTDPTQITHTPRTEDKNLAFKGQVTHTLDANNFYNLAVSYFVTERFTGDGVLGENLSAYARDFVAPEWDQYELFRERNVDGEEAYYGGFMRKKSSHIALKGDFTSQVNIANTVKFGFEFSKHKLRLFSHTGASIDINNLANRSLYRNRYGYDSLGVESDNESYKNNTKEPVLLGIYIQDRFDWRGLIINAGLRFDYFDYKALRFKNFNNPFDPDSVNIVDRELDPEDLEPSKKYYRVSPRFGISFPISDKTQMHINYGKFIQRPDLQNLYVGYDFFEARTSAGFFSVFSSPNLEPEKSTQYEVGINHQLGEFTAFEITAYYKDVQDLTQGAIIQPARPTTYNIFSNVDYGTIKGVDIGFTMRRNKNISASIKYGLSFASGTGSYSGTNRNILWKNTSGIPKTTNPLDYDQRHTIIANVDIRSRDGEGPTIGGIKPFENVGFNALIQLGSGTPYTPMIPYDAVTAISVNQFPRGGINTANLPWQASVDIKIDKTITISDKYKIVPYFWVRNLLDRKNIVAVYEGTGQANSTGFINTDAGQQNVLADGQDYLDKYSFLENNPKNYGTPRMIFFGLRVSF